MGLGSGSGGSVCWLALKNGKFVKGKKDEQQTEYTTLEGEVTGIEFRDAEYQGKKWREAVIGVTDSGVTYKFGVGIGTGYGKQLLSKLVNADLNKPMKLEPTYKEENGKKISGFFVTQGKALKQLWTRDTPNGMPQMVPVTVKGQTIWDDTEQVAFIEKYYNENIIPKMSGSPSTSAAASADDDREAGDDDIPF